MVEVATRCQPEYLTRYVTRDIRVWWLYGSTGMKQKQVPDFVKSRMGAGTIDHPAFSFGCLLLVPSKNRAFKAPYSIFDRNKWRTRIRGLSCRVLTHHKKNIIDTNTRTETYFVSIQRSMSTPKLWRFFWRGEGNVPRYKESSLPSPWAPIVYMLIDRL